MALNINSQFTPRANPPSADYPTGSFKDSSLPGVFDGTPLTAIDRNDLQGFTDALLAAAGITHSGTPDTATSSQRFDALVKVISAFTGITPVSGGGVLEVNKRYWIMDSANYTLPNVTSLSNSDNVELYRIGGTNNTPTINVDGSNSEQIDYFNILTGVLLETDVSVIYNITAPITLIFNVTSGNWEI